MGMAVWVSSIDILDADLRLQGGEEEEGEVADFPFESVYFRLKIVLFRFKVRKFGLGLVSGFGIGLRLGFSAPHLADLVATPF